MTGRIAFATLYTFLPGNPAVFGSVDEYILKGRMQIQYASLSSEMTVRAGRDSEQAYYRVWYRKLKRKPEVGDRLEIDSKMYLIVHLNDSPGTLNYLDVRAV